MRSRLLNIITSAIIVLALLSFYGWSVRKHGIPGNAEGLWGKFLVTLTSFPDLITQAAEEVEKLPGTFVPTHPAFAPINRLDYDINVLVSYSNEDGNRAIEIRNLKTQSVKKSWEVKGGLKPHHRVMHPLLLSNDRMAYATNGYDGVYCMNAKGEQLWHQKEIKDPNFSSKNYTSKRIWARANDGTEIPVSLVYKKGIDLSKAPLLLYGYGSYGITIPDVFSATRLSLLDRGFVFAVAHIRGGKYMGEHWYENGKFMKKINTFTDFINAAEYLGHMGYCDPSRIYAQGGSAGGLLMGAISNMAPYLWKGVVSQVPFVDVLTTMLDETIPLTTSEYEEWGNPNDEAYYYYLLKYSPYDNIKKMEYPAMYITTGYHDSQVQYWEPLKYVAKMRAFKKDKQPFLFDCNMDAGHGGGSGISNERKEIAKVYAFILGMENKIK